jgi:GPH family glycoside/pentoside/hexuronide:cation symporter
VDELTTHERREGMFSSIFWWVVKLGMAVALGAGGFLLNATGFDRALGATQTPATIIRMRLLDMGVPLVASLVAIWAVATFPITEQKAREVRLTLEERRAKAACLRSRSATNRVMRGAASCSTKAATFRAGRPSA